MGWNTTSIGLLPYGYADEFPVFLIWKAAVDKDVIDLMCPLFNKGLCPESMSKLLLELYSKE